MFLSSEPPLEGEAKREEGRGLLCVVVCLRVCVGEIKGEVCGTMWNDVRL